MSKLDQRGERWFQEALKQLVIIDSSILKEATVSGVDKIPRLKDHKLEKKVLREITHGKGVYEPQPWEFYLCITFDDGEHWWYDEMVCKPEEPILSKDVAKASRQIIQEHLDEVGREHLIGFGYVCVIGKYVNPESTGKGAFKSLKRNGLFEYGAQQHHRNTWKKPLPA